MKTLDRILLLALQAQVAAAVAVKQPRILADTNRDGKVDENDVTGKTQWSADKGAVFLPNMGDKTRRCPYYDSDGEPLSATILKTCHDAADDDLIAPEYLAPLRTTPLDAPDGTVGYISVSPESAEKRVRIFALNGSAASDAMKTESWQFVASNFSFTADELRAGLTLGIDSREIVEDADVWNGTVSVHFDIFSGGDKSRSADATDSVLLRLAPLLTHHHLQDVNLVLSTNITLKEMEPARFPEWVDEFTDRVQDALSGTEATTKEVYRFRSEGDQWAQDFMEPAYASMPGPDGPISIRIIMRSAQPVRTPGKLLFKHLRGPGVGVWQPGTGEEDEFDNNRHTIDSYGNLETIPPYTSRSGVRWPAGRVIIGKHGERVMQEPVMTMLESQGMQNPLLLETGWLAVGHVDEFVQFIPADTELGFTIAIADTRAAIQLMQNVSDAGKGDQLALKASEEHNEGLINDTHTINEILNDKTMMNRSAYAQSYIDENLRLLLEEIPLEEEEVIRVPVFYAEFVFPSSLKEWRTMFGEKSKGTRLHMMQRERNPPGTHVMLSYFPNGVNGLVVGRDIMPPDQRGPVLDGVDVLNEAVREAYIQQGLNISSVDDFLSHHIWGGNVHCGTNTFRRADTPWWK